MPIYEYRSTGVASCELCKDRFEVRQGMNDASLRNCPRCGAGINKLISRPFICLKESLSDDETFAPHTAEEADELGMEDNFAEDQMWD